MTSAISTNNTTTALLLANETYTGIADDVSKYASCVVMVSSDQSGTCKVQHSMDNLNWDISDVTECDSSPVSVQVELKARYCRVLYINKSTDQTYFRLMTLYKQLPQKISLDSTSMTATLAPESQIKVMATDGSSDVQLQVNGSSQLQVFNNSTLSAENDAVSIMGDDSGTKRQLHVDTSGNLHVIVPDGLEVNVANDLNVINSLTIGTMPNVTINDGASVNIGTMPDITFNPPSALSYRNLDVNATSDQIKGSSGKFYGLTINNLSAFSDTFVKLYDKASSASTSDTPILTFYGIANTSTTHMCTAPIAFSNGLQIRATQDLPDNSSVGSSNCAVNVVYA